MEQDGHRVPDDVQPEGRCALLRELAEEGSEEPTGTEQYGHAVRLAKGLRHGRALLPEGAED